MSFTVFVDGQEGTTGLRIHEYLAQRRDVEVLRIDPERRKDAAERARLLNAAVVHLARHRAPEAALPRLGGLQQQRPFLRRAARPVDGG